MSVSNPSTQTTYNSQTISALGQWGADLDYGSYLGVNSHAVYIPAGFTHVSANGNKWLSSSAGADWFRVDAGYYMFRKAYKTTTPTSVDFNDAFSVGAPVATDTIVAWAQNTLDLSGTFNYFLMDATRTSTDEDGEVRIEVTDLTFTLSSATPVAAAGSSIEYYRINASLINTTTGDYIAIDYLLNLNTALIVNTSAHTVVDNDSSAYARGAITLSTYRHDWLKMTPGANVLQWDETGATGLTIVVKRRERKL